MHNMSYNLYTNIQSIGSRNVVIILKETASIKANNSVNKTIKLIKTEIVNSYFRNLAILFYISKKFVLIHPNFLCSILFSVDYQLN